MANVERRLNPPRVHHKAAWSDADWTLDPLMQPLNVSYAVPSHDLSACSLRRRYGVVKQPTDVTPSIVQKVDRDDYWVRVQYDYGSAGLPNWVTIFMGRIGEETRQIHGGGGAAGVQEFSAYGPYHLMRRRAVSTSKWDKQPAPGVRTIEWLPPMNAFDDRNTIIGNRSTSEHGDTYVYSEDGDIWTNRQYCDYLVEHYLNSDESDEPTWVFGGDANTLVDLGNLTQPIEFSDSETVASMLHKLIPRDFGFDWYVYYNENAGDDEFKIHVFALTDTAVTFGSSTINANTNVTQFDTRENPDLDSAIFEKSDSNNYSHIRVLGERMVVCCSFERLSPTLTDLDNGWSAAVETAYEDGTGSTLNTAADHDDYRASDRFRSVYQMFYAKRDPLLLDDKIFPTTEDDGTVAFTTRADAQGLSRETLSWTPLEQGIDYSQDPPVDNNDAEVTPSFLPPAVYLQRIDADIDERYILAEHAGVGVSPLPNDWGVQLHAQPNHLIAGNEFTTTVYPTETDPQYQFDQIRVTLAFRADQRFTLVREDPDPSPNAGGVLDVEVPGAELWVLAPDTVVGLDPPANGLLRSPGLGLVLRSDTERLEQAMAGAVARYQSTRNRAVLRTKGIWNWSFSLGYILQAINDGGAGSEDIKGPITYVRWDFEHDHTTELRAGYAG